MYKNVSGQYAIVYAYNVTSNEPETGDASNITGSISKDAGARAATNDTNPTELNSTYFPGLYVFTLTQAETNADIIALQATSSTSGVEFDPVVIYTIDQSELSDTIWDEAYSGHTTAGTTGYAVGLIAGIVTTLSSIASTIWSYTTRTLTTAAVSSDSSSTGNFSRKRGDSWSISITGMGSISGYSKIWFTVKSDLSSADTAADIQIDTGTGLLYIDGGAAGTAGNGSITVDSASSGDITIALDEVETAKLDAGTYYYDVQVLNSNDVTTPANGTLTVTADVTKATS